RASRRGPVHRLMAGLTARDLKVVRGAQTYPYSRGTCSEALQRAGVPTDAAVAVVPEFERGIKEARVRRIELSELLRHLAEGAEKRAGQGAAERLLRQTPPFVPLLVTTDGEEPMRFSRRTLMASLEKLGLSFKDAHAVTR